MWKNFQPDIKPQKSSENSHREKSYECNESGEAFSMTSGLRSHQRTQKRNPMNAMNMGHFSVRSHTLENIIRLSGE